MKNASQYIPLGILYPVSPGFLRFLRMWSEWIFTTMPINHKAKPKEQTRLLRLIAGQSEESHAQLNRTLPSLYQGSLSRSHGRQQTPQVPVLAMCLPQR